MKVKDIIQEVDSLFPNQFGEQDKLRWLERFHDRVWREIVATHADAPEREECDREDELPFPVAYLDAYVRYLEAQVHYHNGETDLQNDAANACNAAFASLRNWYNARHMPLQAVSHLYLIDRREQPCPW